jgi:transposase
MKQYKYFFGVDVSKKTVDITLFDQQQILHRQFINNTAGMEELQQWLQELNQDISEVLFCMEATGLYYAVVGIQIKK